MTDMTMQCPYCKRVTRRVDPSDYSGRLICGGCHKDFSLHIHGGVATVATYVEESVKKEKLALVKEYKEVEEFCLKESKDFGYHMFLSVIKGLILGALTAVLVAYGLSSGEGGYVFFALLVFFWVFEVVWNKVKEIDLLIKKKNFLKEKKSDFEAFEKDSMIYEHELEVRAQRELAAEAERKRIREETERKRILEAMKAKNFWKNLSGFDFEHEVGNLFRRKGAAVTVTAASGDEGVDLIINDTIIAQCKNHEKPIGRPDFQRLYGQLMHCKGKYKKALMITTSGSTEEAKLWIHGKPIIIVDLENLIGIATDRTPLGKFCS